MRLTYLFCNLVDLRIDFVEPIQRETLANQEMEGRQVVTEVDAEVCPCAPKATSTKFVTQCGVVVRARIPITTRLRKSSNLEEQQHAVPPHQKEILWRELKDMFTFSEGVDEELVKQCALKKMALAFATFKKLLCQLHQEG